MVLKFFHAGSRGSNPLGDATESLNAQLPQLGFFCYDISFLTSRLYAGAAGGYAPHAQLWALGVFKVPFNRGLRKFHKIGADFYFLYPNKLNLHKAIN